MPRRSRNRALAVAALGLAAAAVAWPVAGFASSTGHLATAAVTDTATYTDPANDSKGPDVTTTVLSTDSTGKYTFTVSVPNRPDLSDQDAVQLFIDSDSNSSTGGQGGFEYDVAWLQGHQYLLHWDGSQFSDTGSKTFSGSYKNGTATASFLPADIGGATKFSFQLTTTGDGGSSVGDQAPNGSGRYNWPSTGSPPPPPPPPPGAPPPPPPPPGPPGSPTLIVSKYRIGTANSGKPFTVSMVVRVKETGLTVKTTVACAAKVGKKTVGIKIKGSVLSGRASCTWVIPRKSKGKSVKGSISATYQGAKIKRNFTTRVRT
jgi:hypothetical protein